MIEAGIRRRDAPAGSSPSWRTGRAEPAVDGPHLPRREPADMRKGFDGLAQLVRDVDRPGSALGAPLRLPQQARDRIKILYWDRDGFALWYKRLEKGAFRFPEAKAAASRSPPPRSPPSWRAST